MAESVITPFIPPKTVKIAVMKIRPIAPHQNGSPTGLDRLGEEHLPRVRLHFGRQSHTLLPLRLQVRGEADEDVWVK